MTQKISFIISSLLLLMVITFAIVFNANKPHLMVLHSYNTDYSWTRNVNAGLIRVLEKHPDYAITWHYMDSKKHTDSSWLRRARVIAKQAIDTWNPEVLIVVDNFAQTVAQEYVNKPDISIIFAGVNGSIEPYGYHKAVNVTGILENRQCNALRELILSIKNTGHTKKFDADSKGIRIRYMIDSSKSVLGDKSYIDNFNWAPIVYAGSFVAKNFREWQEEILKSASKTDYIFVTNYRQLPISEADPLLTPPEEVMIWTEKHSPVPVIGLNPFNVEDGGMLSVGVSPYEQGETIAKMTEQIIENGVSASAIPVVPNYQFVVSMRKSAMEKRGIIIPAVYEAFSRATNSYFE